MKVLVAHKVLVSHLLLHRLLLSSLLWNYYFTRQVVFDISRICVKRIIREGNIFMSMWIVKVAEGASSPGHSQTKSGSGLGTRLTLLHYTSSV